MKEYPFHELDYVIREEGSSKILPYLLEPDEAKLEALQDSVKWKVKELIDVQFWDRITQIAHNDIDLSQKVQDTFDWCFELAFWDIKEQWISPKADDPYRHFVKRQYDKSVSESTSSIESKPVWQNYRDQYVKSRDKFFNQLADNLLGYSFVELEERKIAYEPNGNDGFFPNENAQPIGFGNYRNRKIRDIVYERVMNRLFKELIEQDLIANSVDVRADFRGVFYGPFRNKLDWIGGIGQLTYLIKRLTGSKLNDLNIIKDRTYWLTTVKCFTIEGELLESGQLKDTHKPKGKHLTTIDQIIDELRLEIERR